MQFINGKSLKWLTLALITLSISCQSPQEKQEKADSSLPKVALLQKDSISSAPLTPPEGSSFLTGKLHYLWMSASDFKAIETGRGNKLTFRFFFQSPDQMTLHGWFNKRDTHIYGKDKTPATIKLNIGNTVQVSLGDNFYLGNQVLYTDDIQSIQDKLEADSTLRYVIFYPLNPSGLFQQLSYEIYIDDKLPADQKKEGDKSTFGTSTGSFTNPSPPRNGNG